MVKSGDLKNKIIPVSKPDLKGNELRYVTDCIKSGWISSKGDYVRKFEERFAEYHGMKYGIACSSGTTALFLALKALGIGKNEEDIVIVPEFTMVASAWAVSYTGAKIIPVDCGEDFNINVDKLERVLQGDNSGRIKAIMPVHIYGRQCDMDRIMKLAYEYGIRIIEDSCEAHGIKPVGDIACFSLFANKIITAGEGGICLTNDKYFAEQIRHLANMAFDAEHTFLHKKIGYNFRMTNLQAAVALAQMERIDEILEKRRRIERWYDKSLKNVSGITILPKRDVVWYYDVLAFERDGLKEYLSKNEIETRVGFKPMSQQPMYFNEDYQKLLAYKYSLNTLYLPTFTSMTKTEVDYVCKKIKEYYATGKS